MASQHLQSREKWHNVSGKRAELAEGAPFDVFVRHFIDTPFVIQKIPVTFARLYNAVKLDKKMSSEIYYSLADIGRHGIVPDYSTHNATPNTTLYVEVKRRDRWFKGKPRRAGRGNAHERSNQ